MDRRESGFGRRFAPSPSFVTPRMTSVDLRLQEANRRAQIHENFVFFAKLFGFTLCAIGVILVLLDITKIILLWRFVLHVEHRLNQIVNVIYSFSALIFGLAFFYSAVETTRTVLLFVTFSIAIVLCTTLLFPSDSSFMKNIGHAVQLSRLQQHSIWKELLPDSTDIGRDLILSESANRLIRVLSAFSLTHQLHPLGIQDVSMVSGDYLLTVQYCLFTHAALSLLFLTVLLFSFRFFYQMLEIL